jgi:hypothetical protein
MTGIDTQGFGNPPNPQFFDYVMITNINAGTGVITISAPLKYSYSQNWPNFVQGDANTTDLGGPGTLFALSDAWGNKAEYRNINATYAERVSNIVAPLHTIKMVNCAYPDGVMAAEPSVNYLNWHSGCDLGNVFIEFDKCCNTVVIDNCNYHNGECLNPSIQRMIFCNGSTVEVTVNGVGKEFIFTADCVANAIGLGTNAYGGASLAHIAGSAAELDPHGGQDKGPSETGVNDFYGISSGLITLPRPRSITAIANNGSGLIRLTLSSVTGITGDGCQVFGATHDGGTFYSFELNNAWPITVIDSNHIDLVGSSFAALTGVYDASSGKMGYGAKQWAFPGANLFFVGGGVDNSTSFSVTDVTSDANAVYVQTTLVGGWPVASAFINIHPCPQLYMYPTATGCNAVATLRNTPHGDALYSYFQGTYSTQAGGTVHDPILPFGSTTGGRATGLSEMWGNVQEITAAINPPYSGSTTPLSFVWPAVFGNYPVYEDDFTKTTYGSSYDLRTSGTRIIQPPSAPVSFGLDANLQTPSSENVWFTQAAGGGASSDVSADSPTVQMTITATFDQHITPPVGTQITAFECQQLALLFSEVDLSQFYPSCYANSIQVLMGQACL